MEAPRSIGSVRTLGPLLTLLASVVTMTQWSSIAGGDAWMVILLFGAPSLAIAAVAFNLAARDRRNAWISAAVGFVLHFFVILVAANAITSGPVGVETLVVSLVVAILSMGLVNILATPLLVATDRFATRNDLANGDALLGFAGLWFVAVQALELLVASSEARLWLPMMVVSLVPVGIASARAARRRAWCKRIERGEIPGLRLRAWNRHDLDLELPAVDDAPHGDLAVVERFEVGSLPYRSGILGVPIATMRSEVPLEVTP